MSIEEKEKAFNDTIKYMSNCKNCGITAFPSASPELMQGYICICELDGTYVNKERCKACKLRRV